MFIHTKIICTIGPAVHTREQILRLIDAGMNVARLNFSHGTHEEHGAMITLLKELRKEKGVPLAIMLDTKGPEIRIGKVRDGMFSLAQGDRLRLVNTNDEGTKEGLGVVPFTVLEDVTRGTAILFDDGYITTEVVAIEEDSVVVEVVHGGSLKSGKGVNIPDIKLNLPAVTERDIEDIRFGCQQDIDLIAASFVRSAEHVLTIKKLLEREEKENVLVLAKIENREGVNNVDSVIQVADGVMIARGDLGVEIPLSEVPRCQKMMIRKCYKAGKAAVTATQMLESMMQNPLPTRAEVSDVANAIYDSTSAVMLSGETAVGKYPVKTVDMMRSIVKESEDDFAYDEFFRSQAGIIYHDVPSCIALAAVKTAYSSKAKAIFTFTKGGTTARLLSRFRPDIPILAMTPNEKCYHQLAAVWGVIPFYRPPCQTVEEAFQVLSQLAKERGLVFDGDLVVITAGTPFGVSGTTNMMLMESIGDVLVRGIRGAGPKLHGNVTLLISPDEKKPYEVRGNIIVITRCDETYLPFVQEAAGVILQNLIDDTASEKNVRDYVKKSNKSYILRADAAMQILKEGQLVTMDTQKGLVYKGVI